VPLIEVADLLIGGKLLQPHHADDRDELARAVERLLAMLIHAELLGAEGGCPHYRVTRNGGAKAVVLSLGKPTMRGKIAK